MQTEQDELLRQWLELGELWGDLEFATLRAATVAVEHGGTGKAEPPVELTEAVITRLAARADALGIDRVKFTAALTGYLGAVEDSMRTGSLDVPPHAAHDLITARRREVSNALALSPPGVDRTYEVLRLIAEDVALDGSPLEAWADPCADPTNAQRKALAQHWQEQWQAHRERERGATFSLGGGQAFWTSRDWEDMYDDVAYYRVYERYGLHEFDELFDDVAKAIGEAIVESTAAGDPLGRSGYGAQLAQAVADHLWLVSRSLRLRRVLHVQASSAVAGLYHLQDPAGWWPGPIQAGGGVHPPSATATGMAMIAGRRISRDERHLAQRDIAAQWLIGVQNPDGSWSGYNNEPDVLATAVALNAVAHSGRPGLDTICQRAADWLVAQQGPHGLWDGPLPSILLTVTVLDAVRSLGAADVQIPANLRAGLSLVTRSQLLLDERSAEARQLAVIAAYTGLETVLYALLSHPSINATTMRSNGRVIGLDDALTGYEAALVASGTLNAGAHLAGNHVLRSFTNVRDGVVHRGAEPSQQDTGQIVDASVAFCRQYIPVTFGLDPLAD